MASPDGQKIYVSVGSASNVMERGVANDQRRANILVLSPMAQTNRFTPVTCATPLAWHPATGELWTAVNERDGLGDELVPDYITSVKAGAFYGWPYSYYGQNEDPRWKGERPDLVAKAIVPDRPMGAHTASLGLTFYPAKPNVASSFPDRYHNGAFVGQHGSWNRAQFAGYKVAFVPFVDGKPGEPEDFLTGFIADEAKKEVYGRPVGLAVLPDGSLLVADDAGNKIWRISRSR